MNINSYVNIVLTVHKLTNLTPSVFLEPFLLLEYKSEALLLSCELVEKLTLTIFPSFP